ncbi:TolC family protein [Cytophagaceae bacterium ABcell3]|nr:TolC family protein [Cytophagaceae bacterium ABcell3]
MLLTCFQGIAQDENVVPVNLEYILTAGGANNLTIQEYRQRQELANADQRRAREWWLPELYAGFQGHQLGGAAMNADGRFFLDVNRRTFWSGMGLNASWDFGSGIFAAQSAQAQSQAVKHQAQAERNQALLEAVEAYYDFMTAQLNYQAYEQLYHQADTIARQVEVQVEAGMRYESELLLARSNINHMRVQMLSARRDFANHSARLKRLLNMEPEARLISVDTVLVPLELEEGEELFTDFAEARQRRPEVKEAQLRLQAVQLERKTTTTGLLLPTLSFNTWGAAFGGLFSPVQPMFSDQYPETQTFYPTGAWDASLMWRIPLGRIFSGGELQQFNVGVALQETRLRQAENRVNEEVLRARENMVLSREQMEVAEEGSILAREALQQSILRQEVGTVRPFEILQAQEAYLQNRLDYIRSVSDYNKNQYRLYVAEGNDL